MNFPKLLNKPSLDLLKNDFPHTNRFELEHTSISKYPLLKSGLTFSNNTYSVYTSFKNSIYSTQNEIKFDNNGINLLDIKYQPNFVKHANICGKYSRSSGKNNSVFEIYSEYNAEDMKAYASVNVANFYFKLINLYSLPKYPNIKIGGEVQGSMDIKKFQYSLGATYTNHHNDNFYIFSIRSSPVDHHFLGTLTCNFFLQNRKMNNNAMSVEVNQNVFENKTNMNIASIWNINNNNTFVKAKISNDTKIALSLTHTYNDFLTVTLGSLIDMSKLSSPDNTRFGIKLYLKS